jgi:formylglycine-generating enzyme required for sulfatase activity
VRSRRLMFPGWLIAVSAVLSIGGNVAAGAEEKAFLPDHTFRDCPECPEMVVIRAGSFLMGSSDEETARDIEAIKLSGDAGHTQVTFAEKDFKSEHPQHRVNIDQQFLLGKYHVTRGEFATFVRETGYLIEGGCTLWINHRYPDRPEASWQNPGFEQTDRDPVVCVNWQDAKAYIAWLNSKSRGRISLDGDDSYRLPSEAEWEYAARAGTRTARWWGDSVGSGNSNCDGCGSDWDKQRTAPVGSFQVNPFGLADVLGNAWEWTEDCWNENYAGEAPQQGSAWTTGKCTSRVIRGGDWHNYPWVLRSASRSGASADRRANYIGFRIAKNYQELPRGEKR